MSGGSYNYLFQAEPDVLITRGDDLAAMRDRLIELGYANEAAQIAAIISRVERFRKDIDDLMDPIAAVMRGVEWLDSNDWEEDQLRDEVAKYRAAQSVTNQ